MATTGNLSVVPVTMQQAGYDLHSLWLVYCAGCLSFAVAMVNSPGAEVWCATCVRGYHKDIRYPEADS